jgi:uncharacterized protein YecE (DUF72 family)
MVKNNSCFIGVSGFSYSTWKGHFYPKDLKNEQFLEYYSSKLNSVEINSSFYAIPNNVMVGSWSSRTPKTFRFSFKAPRQITHILKLSAGSAEVAERLGKNVALLGDKLGPILFQLLPYLKQDLKLLETFLTFTSSLTSKKVFEFRHESWLNDLCYNMLDKYDAGFCIADTEDMKPVFKTTGDFSYFRLRNESYNLEMIECWASKIQDLSRSVHESYVYLRHDETGQNAVLAQKLTDKM